MRNTSILILFFSFIIYGCQKSQEEIEIPEITDFEFEDIDVKEIKSLLPINLREVGEKFAIYVDEKNKEYKVKIIVSTVTKKTSVYSSSSYLSEKHIVDFQFKEKNISHRCFITSNYTDSLGNKAQGLILSIVDPIISPLSGIVLQYSYNDKALKGPKDDTITILSKTFKNVYGKRNVVESLFKELRFNFDYGMVSFSDYEGMLYRFDRFEE